MADDLGIGRGSSLLGHRHGIGLTDLGVAAIAPTPPATGAGLSLLLESGQSMLLESGNNLLLEANAAAVTVGYALLLESGKELNSEAGSTLRLEL